MDKQKCFDIIDRCKAEINEVVKQCDGNDGNSAFLALELIRDMDRLKKCISIDKISTI